MKFKITGIRLINCGAYKDTYIDFVNENNSPLETCIIAGANGSGKTTLLELITQLAPIFCPRRIHKIKLKFDYAQIDWLINDTPFSLYYGDKPNDAELKTEFLGYDFNQIQTSSGKLYNNIHQELHNIEGIEVSCKEIEQLQKDSDELPSIIYFPAMRKFIELNEHERVVRLEKITQEFVHIHKNWRFFANSLESYLIYLEYAEPEQFKIIIDFMNDININEKKYTIDRRAVKVMVQLKDGSTHGLEKMSAGEQNILIMLAELRRRLVSKHSIVLIDEIEESLHNSFQYKLLQGLLKLQKQMDFQLICTTHSKNIVDYCFPEQIRILTEF